MNKFVYKNLISSTGTNPYIYKDAKGMYALVTNSSEDSVWVDLFISYDEGDTWFIDKYLPVDELKLYDAKMVTVGDSYYVFAHGINKYGVDTIRFIKYDLYLDSNDVYAWDEQWSDFFSNYVFHARVTDVIVDKNQQYIHLAYDKVNFDGTYGVYYAIYALASHQVIFNKPIHTANNTNQHNAKILQIGDTMFSVCWEQENNHKKNQIKYSIFNSISNEFSFPITLSVDKQSDEYVSHYHHSIAKDSFNNIHVVWLETKDSYDTSAIQYISIVNDVVSKPKTISDTAENNKYPFVMCDENDNVYVLYNYAAQSEGLALRTSNYMNLNVRYLAKDYNSEVWRNISDITDNNWNVLAGWCANKNIYSLILEDNEIFFLRIDTAIAEIFKPVDDFAITNVTNSEISFSWSRARNAELITLQRMNEDRYVDSVTVEPVSVTDTWAKVVNLTEGNYKFRLKYTKTNGSEDVFYFNKVFALTEPEFRISWEPIDDIINLTLQQSKETWNDVGVDIKNRDESLTCALSSVVTKFRLSITGGVAEGFSNQVSPLSISLIDNGFKLSWDLRDDITAIQVQESIDGVNWYAANTTEAVAPNSTSCTITNVNDTIYHYRLKYTTSNSTTYSNTVTQANNLKITNVTYNSVSLNWNDVVMNEGKYFQYSIDHGMNWTSTLIPTNDNNVVIGGLNYNKEYQFRIFFPGRFTGAYSNVVMTTTKKKPITDLHVVSQTKTSAELLFTTNEEFDDVDITLAHAGETKVLKLSDLEFSQEDIIVNGLWTGYEIAFTIPNLLKGGNYDIYVTPLESNRGDLSNAAHVSTSGDGISNISITNVSSHSVDVVFNSLERITQENISEHVKIFYSTNNVDFDSVPVDTVDSYTLKNLMQDTKYYIYVACDYGDNFGVSNISTTVTAEDSFKPICGSRIPGECCFCKTDSSYYVFDKGCLYTVSRADNSQQVLRDYSIASNHIYADMDTSNDDLHLVFCYGKSIYYVSFPDEPVLIYSNSLANSVMFPSMKVSYDGIVHIAFEVNYGYKSIVMYCSFKNKELYTSPMPILNDNSLNTCLKLALKNSHASNKGMNGFFISTVDTSNTLKLIDVKVDNNKDSETYKQQTLTVDSFELSDMRQDTYNELDLQSDNLDLPHMLYSSYNTSESMTYCVVEDGKISQVVFNNAQSGYIIPRESLIAFLLNDHVMQTSKFRVDSTAFTDKMSIGEPLQDNYMKVISDESTISVLSFKNGLFDIQEFNISDIEAVNNYIDNNWIANVFELEDGDVDVSVWTDGDVNNYPSMYVKINNLVSDLTPRDSLGNKTMQSINITALDTTQQMYVYKIEFNGQEMTLDANPRLMYDWDSTVIANEK